MVKFKNMKRFSSVFFHLGEILLIAVSSSSFLSFFFFNLIKVSQLPARTEINTLLLKCLLIILAANF